MDFSFLGYGGNDQTQNHKNELWFELADSAGTRELYPFHFRLQIGYCLDGDTVSVLRFVPCVASR